MVNWNCCSALCQNNHRNRLQNGDKLKYYKLPRDPTIQTKYSSILKTTGINFKKGYICCQHWSKGYRSSTADLPDVSVPSSQLERLQNEKKSTKSIRKSKLLKKKLLTAKCLCSNINSTTKRSRKSPMHRPFFENKKRKKSNNEKEIDHAVPSEQSENFEAYRIRLKFLKKRVTELEEELSNTKKVMNFKVTEMSKKSFSCIEMKLKPNTFKYMCGLSIEQFDLLWKCVNLTAIRLGIQTSQKLAEKRDAYLIKKQNFYLF